MTLKLNIGCGNIIIPNWINLDNQPGKGVQYYNAPDPLPYQDSSVDLIFSSHFLEHISYDDGVIFLKDCYRVLVSGGTCRIAVPDMDLHRQLWEKYLVDGDCSIWRDYVNAVGVDEFSNYFRGDVRSIVEGNVSTSPAEGEHKALYTYGLLWCSLFVAGFTHIERSAYQASAVVEMQGSLFDNKPELTLFAEARKD